MLCPLLTTNCGALCVSFPHPLSPHSTRQPYMLPSLRTQQRLPVNKSINIISDHGRPTHLSSKLWQPPAKNDACIDHNKV